MNPRSNLELVVYFLVVVLVLAALLLVAISPDYFMDNSVVYQGF
jgi:hypothetical protein